MVEVRPVSRLQPMYGSTSLLLDVHLGILARQLLALPFRYLYKINWPPGF